MTFEHLPPDAEFVAKVEYGDDVSASVPVRTTAAPDGYDYAAIPQGAQNLRATLSDTGTRITVTWDDPYPGNENHYDAHLIDVETGRRLDRADIVLAGTNSWSTTGSAAFGRVQLGREYRVNVGHDAIPFTEASILVTTPDLPPSSRAARRAAAQAVDPLTLELTSSRDLCTANTLTELSWTIAGGRPPYTLTIDGETVDANAESHRANCGAIPTDPLSGDPLPGPTKDVLGHRDRLAVSAPVGRGDRRSRLGAAAAGAAEPSLPELCRLRTGALGRKSRAQERILRAAQTRRTQTDMW